MRFTVEDLNAATDPARQRLAKNPGLVAAMESLGRERALIYKTLALAGLRKGELGSITVGQASLDGDPPHLVLTLPPTFANGFPPQPLQGQPGQGIITI
jgi:hypothetical protein